MPMKDRYIRRLVSNMKCSVCGQRYEKANVNVLGHEHDLWFLRVFCPACQSHGLVAAVVKEGKPTEAITDLTEVEHSKFRHSPPVGWDDLFDMQNLLKSFQGEMSELLSRG